jgi:hypothetical protein
MSKVVEQAGQVASEHLGALFHRRQPAAGHLGQPVMEKLLRGGCVAILPKSSKGF